MCDFLGVPFAHEKTLGPLTTLQFGGIELDSVRQEARLPSEKIHKCHALLHQFGTFLGTMPMGDVRKTGKGAVSKGPAILPASSSLDSFENRMSGFCRALFKFGASNEVISPMKLIRKPKRKPLIKYCFRVWSYPARSCSNRSTLTGVTRELPRRLS